MQWRFEVQRVPTAISTVRAGLGLTVLPRIGLDAHGAAGLVGVPLRNPTITRSLGLVLLREHPLPPNALLLADLITRRLKHTFTGNGEAG